MILYPMKFKEVFKQYFWGGEGFDKINKNAPDNFAAESWEIACHRDGMSIVENGSLAGLSLKQLIKEYGYNLVGINAYKPNIEFPLLIKFINARHKLSIQVHPNDEYASAYEGDLGKSEAWVILEADEKAEITVGIKKEINKKDFINCIKNNEIENCLNKVAVKTGDMIEIPAGLIHGIGEGILLAEIQQNSNATYRLYDYERTYLNGKKRPLHIEKALDVINFDLQANIVSATKNINYDINKGTISNKYFIIENYKIAQKLAQKTNGDTFFVYIFIEGNGRISYRNEKFDAVKGDTYLIPANLGMFEIEGKVSFIKTYIP